MAKKWIALLLVVIMALIVFFAVAEIAGPEPMLPDVILGQSDQPSNETLSPELAPFNPQEILDQYKSDKPQKEYDIISGTYWH